MEEIWKDIAGFEGYYQVSNFGCIKTLERIVPFGNQERIVKSRIRKAKNKSNGYLQVALYGYEKKEIDRYVHRLVAFAFCKGYFKGADVNHKDGNKHNNNSENLEWCSRSENQLHSYKILKRTCYSKGRFGKLSNRAKPIIQLSLNGSTIKHWDCAADVQRELGFNEANIRKCLYGETKTANGYKWEYQKIQLLPHGKN